MSPPLAGVRVLDLSRFVSGPLCTFLLASMGAEVISVESPRTSTSRRLPPFAHPDGGSTRDYVDGALSIPFLKRSRGKRSVGLDITRPEGADLARTLAAHSDVLVENSRSDAMTGFGAAEGDVRAADGGVLLLPECQRILWQRWGQRRGYLRGTTAGEESRGRRAGK